MFSRSWKIGLASGIVGIAIGWFARSPGGAVGEASGAGSGTRFHSASAGDRPREGRDGHLAARWIDRMQTGDAGEVAAAVPTGDLRAVISGVMDTVWGTLSAEDQGRLEALIGEWALRDADAALAWARSLRQPQQREVGLTSIAAALAESDPHRAFDIYAEQERVTLWLGREKIEKLISTLSKEATMQGPQALLDLFRRIPENDTNGVMGLGIDYPEGFDYAAMLDGLAESGIGIHGPGEDSSKPFEPQSPLRRWAVKDPDAAFSYFLSKTGSGYRLHLGDLTQEMEEKWGRDATQAWLGEKVAALDSSQRLELIKGTGILNHPSQLENLINGIEDPSIAQEVRYEALQASAGSVLRNFQLLANLPLDEKLQVVGRLRGVKDTEYLESILTTWDVPRERIDAIVRDVSQAPEEEGK